MTTYGYLLAVVVISAGVLGVVAARVDRSRLPLAVVLATALGLRVVVALIAQGHTPHDVRTYFLATAVAVREGRDPATTLPMFQWNFTAFVPTIYAALQQLHLPWELTVKILPVLADLAIVAMLPRLVDAGRARSVQWLYATSPVAVLVSAEHGQIETFLVALGIAALLVARRSPLVAGVLIGLAVAGKTWPGLFAPALLVQVPWRRWWLLALGGAGALSVWMLESVLFLNASLSDLLHVVASYRSFVSTWGWAGIARVTGHLSQAGYTGPGVTKAQHLSTLMLVVAWVVVLVLLRRAQAPRVVLALICALLITSAGFGAQYLVWAVPFALTQVRRTGYAYLLTASAYAVAAYCWWLLATPEGSKASLPYQTYLSLPVLLACAAVLVRLVVLQRADDRSDALAPPAAPPGHHV